MTISCNRCGAETDNAGDFHSLRRSFRRQKIYYCPFCWTKRQQLINLLTPLLWLSLSFFGVILVLWGPEQVEAKVLGWVILNLALAYLFFLLHLLPHELGHALVARLVGWRVFKIVLGQGKTLGHFRCLGFRFEINAIPTVGITYATSAHARFYRFKRFLFVLAGPLTNVLLVGAVLLLLPVAQLIRPWPGTYLFAWQALLVSWLLLLIVNLFPFHVQVASGTTLSRVESDGLALCTAFFLSDAAIRERQAAYFVLEAMESFQERDYEAARKWNEQGLVLFPEDIQNRFHLAFVLLFLRELHAAR